MNMQQMQVFYQYSPSSWEFVRKGQHVCFYQHLTQTACLATTGEGTSSLRIGDDLLVDGGQNDEALLVSLHETIHRVVFILVVAHFLPDALQVQADRRVANDHFEAHLAYFLGEGFDLPCDGLLTIVDGECFLNVVCYLPDELVGESRLVYLSPVRLVGLPEDTLDWSVELGQTGDLFQGRISRSEVLLHSLHQRLEQVLVKEDHSIEV